MINIKNLNLYKFRKVHQIMAKHEGPGSIMGKHVRCMYCGFHYIAKSDKLPERCTNCGKVDRMVVE